MKIVIAPDSYKGSLTAMEVADSIEKGILKVVNDPIIEKIPMADGGEGTVQSLVDSTGGKIIYKSVKGPVLKDVNAFYGILGDGKTAIIEMAAASGLPLISKEERDPMKTTSYGTGQLIKDAMDKGCTNIIIGLGGSATNDGGIGMAKALGVKFLDINGEDIGHSGGSLCKLHSIDMSSIDSRIGKCTVTAACDVDNPLCGREGASHVFGPQKGADGDMVKILDKNLAHYANIIKNNLNMDIVNIPGSGAAGGLGAGVMVFLNSNLKRGIDIVIDITKLDEKIKDADLIFTGEGMIDFQTAFGKTPFGVAKVADKYGIPVLAIAGGIGKNAETLYNKGFESIFSIVDKPMSLEDAMKNGKMLIEKTSERIMRILNI